MGMHRSASEPWPQVLYVLSTKKIWPLTNLLPDICWKIKLEMTRSLKHHDLPHRPQLETSCSLCCEFGMSLQAIFRDFLFWPLRQWVAWAGVGLAPVLRQEQREPGERNKCPAEPWEFFWAQHVQGERIHYILGKSENPVAHRTLQAAQQMFLVWLVQEAGIKATSRDNGSATTGLKRVQTATGNSTFTWRTEEELWNWTQTLEAGIRLVRCFKVKALVTREKRKHCTLFYRR